MEQSELLLVLGAIVIFGLISLSVNQHILVNSDAVYGQQAELYAVSVAQRYIEEAKMKAFDENAINNSVGAPSSFTNPGKDGGETYPLFDDVDDFNNFSSTLTELGTMNVSITVGYVTDANLDSIVVGTKTYYKKMTVTVQSDYLNHAVEANYVFAYQKN